jgi:tetratricopeptide (TPR) repeat protein
MEGSLRDTALAATRAKDWPAAIDAWRQVIAESDNRSGAADFPQLLKALRSANRFDEAAEALEKAPAKWKTRRGIRLEAGEVAFALGQWSKAAEEFSHAIEGDLRARPSTWR